MRTDPVDSTHEPRPHTAVPGPDGVERWRLLHQFVTCGGRPTEVLSPSVFTRIRDSYGPIARIPVPARPDVYVLSEPEYVGRVLERNQRNYRKQESQVEELTRIFGRGLVTADGDYWRRHRRVLSPMLAHERVGTFTDTISRVAETTFGRWHDRDRPVELAGASLDLILRILGLSLFGDAFDRWRDEIEEGLSLVREGFPREASPIPTAPAWVPTPHNRKLDRARAKLDGSIERMIATRRESGGDHADLLGRLLASDEVSGSEVRDELKTLLIAGLVTATALGWTLYLLARHREVQARLRSTLDDGSNDLEPPPASGGDGTLLQRVIRETLRLYPPLPPAVRCPVSEDVIGGYVVPAGSRIVTNQVQIHRAPDIWEDPLTFRPDRFDGGWREGRPKYSYYPFGGGPRKCVGRAFAYAILQRLLSLCVSDYCVDAEGTQPESTRDSLAIMGRRITLTERTGS